MRQATAYEKFSVDPVCGMSVNPSANGITSELDGQTYYFCAECCRKAFEDDPQKFIRAKKKGLWGRYMDRLQKATGGKAMKCH